MPIIKSAKKKLKQDVKRTKVNKRYKTAYEKVIRKIKNNKSKDFGNLLKEAYSAIDKAIKKKIIHKNRGARLKSRVAKLTHSK